MTNIISLISPTIDSEVISGFIKLAISSICTSLFPSALGLGIPIMIFLLVLEKEDNVKNLLQVNGLREFNYWVSFLLWNFLILSFAVIIFLSAGWSYIQIDFFSGTNKSIVIWFLSAWNLGQIGFSLFVAGFINKGTTATLVGYTLSVFLILYLTMTS